MDIFGHPDAPLVQKDSNPGHVSLSAGGVARNIAHNLALLGEDVKFISAFGEDAHAAQLAEGCRRVGMDISNSLTVPGGVTSTYMFITDEHGDMMLAMLKLDEFQNPLTGLNFQGTGTLTTPLGAKLLRTSAMPAGILIGLDRNYALEQICGSEITVEYDKLIDRQLERAAITSISGFAKLFTEASKVLVV